MSHFKLGFDWADANLFLRIEAFFCECIRYTKLFDYFFVVCFAEELLTIRMNIIGFI